MAVVIRLARHGSKKKPHYRMVVADKEKARDGRFLEVIGTYNPHSKEKTIKEERLTHWIEKGAKPSETVSRLVKAS